MKHYHRKQHGLGLFWYIMNTLQIRNMNKKLLFLINNEAKYFYGIEYIHNI